MLFDGKKSITIIKDTNYICLSGVVLRKVYHCKECGKKFQLHKDEMPYKNGKFIFCSYNCRAKWRRKKGVVNDL